ncbi:MAG: Type IV pilus biogenesis protein PilM [Candidatus Magasanikbacteria bacterium GW2011_GWA2_56_11]|uniref:Type IV pilus biogenesis protein PilM n=1 Tax=Candidatus Magasanikbacteria bacterium GW2011_GWA2_56_11 TaxID=1619044 RepID=A0A0G2AMY9_9BACT|nr:MAG: Type IV pilus biogenesis protein PilM [Candidatus Magasanikbacteria bacterium GW2011_GWA2_56_11]
MPRAGRPAPPLCMLSNPFPHAFGLDIGDLSLKLVQLDNLGGCWRGPRYRIRVLRSLRLPYGLIVNGELVQPEQVRHYIAKLLAGTKQGEKPVKSPWVVACLPEAKTFVKLITVGKAPEEIIEDDIMLEAKRHIPFADEDKYYLDWHALPCAEGSGECTRVLIGACPQNIADSYTYLLESLGLGVVGLEIEALAIVRTMITAGKVYAGEARGILDLGAARSSLIIYDNDSVQFSTSLNFSGEIITTAIQQAAAVAYEKAEADKLRSGLALEGHERAHAGVLKLAENLARDIDRAINFYYTHFPRANRITHITMCGGSARLVKLPELLTHCLKIDCAPGLPWKNLSEDKHISAPQFPDIEPLTYATAIGLALRAADNIHSPSPVL